MGRACYKSAKEPVGALSSVSASTKERPCHVYSDSMPTKQITGQTIMHNEATSGFEVKS